MSSADRSVSRLKQKQAALIFKKAMRDGARQQALFFQCLNMMPFRKRVTLAFRLVAGKVKLNKNENAEQQAD
jgi:hypothetical protein